MGAARHRRGFELLLFGRRDRRRVYRRQIGQVRRRQQQRARRRALWTERKNYRVNLGFDIKTSLSHQ